MGPHHACSYADTAIDKAIDRKVMSDENPWKKHIAIWARLRDDIFSIWTGPSDNLQSFDEWLNNLQRQLRFTRSSSQVSEVFLEIRVSVENNNRVSTSMYSKDSDTHSYLLPGSCHPTHIFKNIPTGVMKRVRRNCSKDTVRDQTYQEYKTYLGQRDYEDQILDEAIDKAEQTPRAQLMGMIKENISQKHDNDMRKFPLIMKFNPRLPPMSKFIRQNLHILSLTPETCKLFNSDTLFVSYKMEQNILSMITKNRMNQESDSVQSAKEISEVDPTQFGCYHCDSSCTLCENFMVETKTFTSSKTNQIFKIKSRITCNTLYVIYLIEDILCADVFYVGYTKHSMKVRWPNHKSHIKKLHKSCEIASHFIDMPNAHQLDRSNQKAFTSQLSQQLKVTLIESVEPRPGTDIVELLTAREKFWQDALKASKLFGGINKK